MDDAGGENFGSKTIVIHVGSQNLRIGLATDALPRTVPMVIAKKADRSEAEDTEPRPKRQKLDPDAPSEDWFGEEVGACDADSKHKADRSCSLPRNTTRWPRTSRSAGELIGAVSCPIPANS